MRMGEFDDGWGMEKTHLRSAGQNFGEWRVAKQNGKIKRGSADGAHELDFADLAVLRTGSAEYGFDVLFNLSSCVDEVYRILIKEIVTGNTGIAVSGGSGDDGGIGSLEGRKAGGECGYLQLGLVGQVKRLCAEGLDEAGEMLYGAVETLLGYGDVFGNICREGGIGAGSIWRGNRGLLFAAAAALYFAVDALDVCKGLAGGGDNSGGIVNACGEFADVLKGNLAGIGGRVIRCLGGDNGLHLCRGCGMEGLQGGELNGRADGVVGRAVGQAMGDEVFEMGYIFGVAGF